jgi:hypothetical protein
VDVYAEITRSMAKKRRGRKSRRPETLTRTIAITAVNTRVSLSPSSEREPEPEFESHAMIELTGTMDEPIRDIAMYRSRCTRPPRNAPVLGPTQSRGSV